MTDDKFVKAANILINRFFNLKDPSTMSPSYTVSIGIIFDDDSDKLLVKSLLLFFAEEGFQSIGYYLPNAITQKQESIPENLKNSIDGCEYIINIFKGLPEKTSFRRKTRQYSVARGKSVAHMIGVDYNTFCLLADESIDDVIKDSEELAHIILYGQEMKIITDNGNRILKVDLTHIRGLPASSTGILARPGWGNVPSGETFINPSVGSFTGDILIDGSILSIGEKVEDPFYIEFDKTRVRGIGPHSNNHVKKLIKVLKPEGFIIRLDEIGFGVSNLRTPDSLTGGFLDEKAKGTAHIGLGYTDEIGKSTHHIDLVMKKPHVLIDNITLIKDGEIRIEDYLNEFIIHIDMDYENSKFRLIDNNCRIRLGKLYFLWTDSQGRECIILVGDSKIAQIASSIWKLLIKSTELRFNDLIENISCKEEDLKEAISAMKRLRIIAIL